MNDSARLKSVGEKLFLLVTTLFLAHSIWDAAVRTHGFAAGAHGAETDRCKLLLEVSDAIEEMGKAFAAFAPVEAVSASNAEHALDEADECLVDDSKSNPDDALVLAKIIIVRHGKNAKVRPYFDKLCSLGTEESERFVAGLSEAYGLTNAKLPHATETKASITLPVDFMPVSTDRQVGADDPQSAKSLKAAAALKSGKQGGQQTVKKGFIEAHLPGGWFAQHALLDWEQRTGQAKLAQITRKNIELKAHSFLILFLCFVILSSISLFIGIIVVVVQLFLVSRRMTPADQLPLVLAPANFGWLQIYKVFVLWLLTQIVVGLLAKPIMPGASASVLTIATFIMLTYTISNTAGLFYVYWFALRPHQIKFFEGVKLRTRVGKSGPVGLCFAGLATWFACLPIVLISYLIALRYLGSHGSSNPVIARIREAAHAQDPLAIIVFYLTIGVIAPICEESLFRGFLYPSLRRVMNVPLAMFFSAALFSLAHLDIGAMLPLFGLGCVFAFVVERTKSILPSIIAHGLWNSGTFTLVLLLFGS